MGPKKSGGKPNPERTVRSKRPLILDTAFKLFVAHGFSQTTMADIALEASISTATLYKHFRSKENLFAAVTDAALNKFKDEFSAVDVSQPIITVLTTFAHIYIRRQYGDGINALMRTIIAEATANPAMGKRFYRALRERQGYVVAYLDLLISQNKLDIDDAPTAALVLISSVKEFLIWPALFDPAHTPPDNADEYIQQVMETFISCWTPKQETPPTA